MGSGRRAPAPSLLLAADISGVEPGAQAFSACPWGPSSRVPSAVAAPQGALAPCAMHPNLWVDLLAAPWEESIWPHLEPLVTSLPLQMVNLMLRWVS